MGLEAGPELAKQFGGEVPNAQLQNYVKGVGVKIASVCERGHLDFEYTLVSSKVPNAFALPGGQIFITAGLMSRMHNERELAAVLGHETGHVCALHNIKGMQRTMGADLLVQIANAARGGTQTTEQVGRVVAPVGPRHHVRADA